MMYAHRDHLRDAIQFVTGPDNPGILLDIAEFCPEGVHFSFGKAEKSVAMLAITEPKPLDFYVNQHVLKEGDWLLRDGHGKLSSQTNEEFVKNYCQIRP